MQPISSLKMLIVFDKWTSMFIFMC